MKLTNEKMQEKLHKVKAKLNLKKTIALTLAGAFIAAGAAQLPPETAFAATATQQVRQYHHNYNYDNDAILQDMQDCFGIKKKVLTEYQAKGWRIPELHQAAFIAQIAKVPIADVLNAKAQNKTWNEITESYGITRDQYFSARRDFRNNLLAKNLNMRETEVKSLITKGYHPRDIAMAHALAQKANTSVDAALGHKKINNTWRDVATTLGLSDEAYESCRSEAQNCFGYNHGGRQNFRHHRQW